MPRKLAPLWIVRDGCTTYGLTAVQRAVLLCLWDHADVSLVAFPGHPTIAAETGFAQRSTKKAVMELFERGFIRRADGRTPKDKMEHSRHAVKWVMVQSPESVVHLVH